KGGAGIPDVRDVEESVHDRDAIGEAERRVDPQLGRHVRREGQYEGGPEELRLGRHGSRQAITRAAATDRRRSGSAIASEQPAEEAAERAAVAGLARRLVGACAGAAVGGLLPSGEERKATVRTQSARLGPD